jgi:hypothetical protein
VRALGGGGRDHAATSVTDEARRAGVAVAAAIMRRPP